MTESPRLQQLRAMLADDPSDPFTRYAIGLELAGLGERSAAVEQLQALTADSPDYVPTYLMLAQQLQQLGRNPEAVDVLRAGCDAARRAGDAHAVSELEALLDSLS